VLLLGPSGSGKSDLLLRLIDRGFVLIADDQVECEIDAASGPVAKAPPALAGLLEVRGFGLVRMPHAPARLVLAVQLGVGERLPAPKFLPDLDLPVITMDASAASAPERIALALDCLQGRIGMVAGAFA
jgi:HPr kinase/phosphorylase